MLDARIAQDETFRDYPTKSPFTGSSRVEESYISEVPYALLSPLAMQKMLKERFFRDYIYSLLFEVDMSSIRPHFEVKIETFSIEEATPKEMLEYDIVVRMLPKRKYTIELEVKSIKKAEPKIVEPEWI